ncbi:hypothetical protein STEG23_015455, partial [Scotinomys teguina]
DVILAVNYSYSAQEQNKEERGITSEKDRREKLRIKNILGFLLAVTVSQIFIIPDDLDNLEVDWSDMDLNALCKTQGFRFLTLHTLTVYSKGRHYMLTSCEILEQLLG